MIDGDDVLNSSNSRYWGFVSEEYIVGIADCIPYSIDKYTDEIQWKWKGYEEEVERAKRKLKDEN